MEIQDIAKILIEGIKFSPEIETVVAFMNDKSLQITTVNGEMFNVCVVKARTKINRKPIYERRTNENDSNF